MRKISLLLVLLLASVIPVCAQSKDSSKKKEIKEWLLKYLAQEMELTPEQQKPFFELYSQYLKERHKLMKETKAKEKQLSENPNVSEAEIKKAKAEAKEKEAEIERRYNEKFSKFLSQKQIAKMKVAEKKFKEMMDKKKNSK